MALPLWLSPVNGNDDSDFSGSSSREQVRRNRATLVARDERADPLLEEGFSDRLRSGDPAAFDTLFSATYQGLVRFASRLTPSLDTAEDLVMEVFRRVWERRYTWAPDDARVYLYGAVRNAAATATRDASTRRTILGRIGDGSPGMAAAPSDVAESIEDGERLAALMRALDMLPERQRLAFTLRRERGLTNANVADVLGIAVKTVEKDLTAAFKTLRLALASFCEDS